MKTEELRAVEALLADGKDWRRDFRREFPGLTLTVCDSADIDNEPYSRPGGINLYLVDGRDHCRRLTDDPEQATGIIAAL